MGDIAVLNGGLWRLRREIAALSGMMPVRGGAFRRPAFDAVAGWGRRPTSDGARRLAARSGKPYLAFEDGPLRSVRPGPDEPPLSMVLDRGGIYYRAGEPSDLTDLLADAADLAPPAVARAEEACRQLRELRLSKYNSGPECSPAELGLRPARRRVLVLDQVRGDESVRGAGAGAASFAAMLGCAIAENEGAEIVVKQHPDVLSGRRAGYFSDVRRTDRVSPIARAVNPWSLLDICDVVYTVSSGLGLEALIAGAPVVTFGASFYSGWGLTDDRRPGPPRPRAASLSRLVDAYYLTYARYFDSWSRREIPFEEACAQLAWRRDRFMDRTPRAVCYKITRWKRPIVDRMLDGPDGRPLHVRRVEAATAAASKHGGAVVAWASRDHKRLETACRCANLRLTRVEDGFIRSAGLGASFVRPLSLVFDRRGIYYDSSAASDLEALIETGDFPPAVVERAARLRRLLVERGTTKYNVAPREGLAIHAEGRPVVLVPGQVEDDASIARGSPAIRRNIDLLAAARARHPHAFIVYKPHPDVEAGFRRGRVDAAAAARLADGVVANASIAQLIGLCERVETMTSLAGFEALLRGKAVTTHGQPFYAGWGLTEDLAPIARRTRAATLDELVAAALILYPDYIDPETGLPCGPEIVVERLAAAAARRRTPAERVADVARASAARALHLGHALLLAARRAP
jgi:capsular polysaccharide export protein